MDPVVFAVVLAAAFFHATWNALIKVEGDRLVAMALLNVACALCGLPFIIWGGELRLEVVPWVLLSGALHTVYFLMLIAAYRVGDLSHVYPIARGSSPLLVALFATFFIGERLPPVGIFAVILISIGIVSLTVLARNIHAIWGRATIWAIAIGVMISIYTVIDGAAVRLNGDVLPFIGWLFVAGYSNNQSCARDARPFDRSAHTYAMAQRRGRWSARLWQLFFGDMGNEPGARCVCFGPARSQRNCCGGDWDASHG